MMFKSYRLMFCTLLICVLFFVSAENAFAQAVDQEGVDAVLFDESLDNIEGDENDPLSSDEVNDIDIPSVLFTASELQAITNARNSDVVIASVRDCEVEECGEPEVLPPPPPEKRYIRLGGIVFNSTSDWTIWLNKTRVTPKALPPEIMDLKVFKQYVEMKWYDEYTKQILPIRIRPHQSFHMDQRIFLPG